MIIHVVQHTMLSKRTTLVTSFRTFFTNFPGDAYIICFQSGRDGTFQHVGLYAL